MTLRPAIYFGAVMHRRLRPRRHRFRYRAFWLLLDLDQIPALSDRLWWFSHNRPNVFSFQDRDHGDGSPTPLRHQIERRLADAGIALGPGPIWLLCMPRTLGHCFNPLSVYFCHRTDGSLGAVVYEVHNTFGERRSYVIRADEAGDGAVRQRCRKDFYVSPFMDMDMQYEFRVVGPDDKVMVGICVRSPTGLVLSAVLTGRRFPLTDRQLGRAFAIVPAVTMKVIAAIHFEALRLWIKRIGLRPRPGSSERPAGALPAGTISAD